MDGLTKFVAGARKNHGKTLLWFIVCAALILWQASFLKNAEKLDRTYVNGASTGILQNYGNFLYFLYHLGQFPIGTSWPLKQDTRAGALEVIRHHGSTLYTEKEYAIRFGDWARYWLFLPSAYLQGGETTRPSVIAFNFIFFSLTLFVLLYAFWTAGYGLIGVALVLLIGSDPYQIFELYQRNNIFGFPITVCLLLLALNLPFLLPAQPSDSLRRQAAPALSGVILATAYQVRTEATAIALSIVGIYLIAPGISLPKRFRLALVCALCGLCSAVGWRAYFDSKFNEATRLVEAAGGNAFKGLRSAHHTVWHSVFCGLGDFDKKHGYAWDDYVAYQYSLPILNQRYGWHLRFGRDHNYMVEQEGREKDPFGVKLELVPEYSAVIREKVLHDVFTDPIWYLGILGERLKAAARETPPVRLGVGAGWLTLPLSPLAWVVALVFALIAGDGFALRLLFFPLPLLLPALLIYSQRGMTYYGIQHLVATAVLVGCLASVVRQLVTMLRGIDLLSTIVDN